MLFNELFHKLPGGPCIIKASSRTLRKSRRHSLITNPPGRLPHRQQRIRPPGHIAPNFTVPMLTPITKLIHISKHRNSPPITSGKNIQRLLGRLRRRIIRPINNSDSLIPKIGFIAGSYVKEGKVHRNAMGRIKRNDEVLHEAHISSLRRFKDDVKEVQEGFECGIALEGFTKYEQGDIIEVFDVKSVKRKLV